MINLSEDEKKFKEAVSFFEGETKGIRAGRTNPAMVEGVLVEVYGEKMPLSHVASISTPDPKSIIISPWDKSNIPAAEQAINRANLGLSIVADKEQIRLTLQPMSEERRKELVKILGKKTEEARISVRRLRDELWKTIQSEFQEKKISEDQKFSLKEKMEELVEEINTQIAKVAQKKEEEIMEI